MKEETKHLKAEHDRLKVIVEQQKKLRRECIEKNMGITFEEMETKVKSIMKYSLIAALIFGCLTVICALLPQRKSLGYFQHDDTRLIFEYLGGGFLMSMFMCGIIAFVSVINRNKHESDFW